MPRTARNKSATNTYHIMLRGINQQEIFSESEDYIKFLSVLRECKKICGFELFAYCVMSNHVHLLLKVIDEPLDQIFKRIGSRFVYWYNMKYQRSGHLFQDRFKSQPVENDISFLNVLRYIIQNPMNAGIESAPGKYPWSSFRSYQGLPDYLTNTSYVMSLFSSNDDLIKFVSIKGNDTEMEIENKSEGITDEMARKIIQNITGCQSVSDFLMLEKKQQRIYLSNLRQKHLSLNQLARLTGISKTTILRYTKDEQGGCKRS